MEAGLEANVNENQQIDLAKIRQFFAVSDGVVVNNVDLQEIKPMVLELCEIAENSGLLQDVQEVREEGIEQDESARQEVLASEY